jgi:hypothetical protein
MGHQPNADRNQPGSHKPDQKISAQNPQSQNKNDNNATQSNQPGNRTSQQNENGRSRQH